MCPGSRRLLPLALAGVASAALGGCELDLPGESRGTFAVEGTLEENGCGAEAVPARDPLRFPVELREDDGRALWRRAQQPLVEGTIEDDGSYRFEARVRLDVLEADPAQGQAACVLVQQEVLTARVIGGGVSGDAGAGGDASAVQDGGEARLEGTQVIDMKPAAGSDCSPVLAASGGPFLELPCTLAYTLDGTPRDPF